jgi:hypothetical protein
MAIMDLQIVTSSLTQIQGGLSASSDEIAWVKTAYLIADVVMVPLSGIARAPKLWRTESLWTLWRRELDSKFQFRATFGGVVGSRYARSEQTNGSHRNSFRLTPASMIAGSYPQRSRVQHSVAIIAR